MYDLLVFVGRFAPFHQGHRTVVDKALSLADRVLLLLGTNNDGRTLRNPWTYHERKDMIRSVYPDVRKVFMEPVYDKETDALWIEHVNSLVKRTIRADANIGLIGCNKDHTSYYLDLFPNYHSEAVEFINPLNATDIREMLWEGHMQKHELIDTVLPHSVADVVFQPDMGMESVEVAEQLRQKYLNFKATIEKE